MEQSSIAEVLGFSQQYTSDILAITHVSDSIVRAFPYDFINVTCDVTRQQYSDVAIRYLTSFTINQYAFGQTGYVALSGSEIPTTDSFFRYVRIGLFSNKFQQVQNNNTNWMIAVIINFLA